MSGGPRLPFDGRLLVSVVVPTRNRRDLLLRALQSVREQTYGHWEVVVVDDGSTDGTADAVLALADPRVRCIADGLTHGGGHARHRGAKETRGDFIAFLDSDDRWLPEKLERQLGVAERAGPGPVVVFCPPRADDGYRESPVLQATYAQGQRISDYVYSGQSSTVLSSCLLVEGALGRRVRFDPDLPVNQDTDYLLRLEREGARFLGVDEPLYVLDVRLRRDRIGLNPLLRKHSYDWYRRVSGDWSPAARRGYLFWDYAMRCAHTGRRDLGLLYLVRGFAPSIGVYRALRQFLRVIGGGDVPSHIKKVVRRIPRRRV